jgi:hypothetical protein
VSRHDQRAWLLRAAVVARQVRFVGAR